MNHKNILLVAEKSLPVNLKDIFSPNDFLVHQTRGCLKTKQILKEYTIDSIVWYFSTAHKSLQHDLIKTFNQSEIPVVVLTDNVLDNALFQELHHFFGKINLDNNFSNIQKLIKKSCNLKVSQKDARQVRDMDFKHMFQRADQQKEVNDFIEITPWNTVNQLEKQMLANANSYELQKSFFRKVLNWVFRKN